MILPPLAVILECFSIVGRFSLKILCGPLEKLPQLENDFVLFRYSATGASLGKCGEQHYSLISVTKTERVVNIRKAEAGKLIIVSITALVEAVRRTQPIKGGDYPKASRRV